MAAVTHCASQQFSNRAQMIAELEATLEPENSPQSLFERDYRQLAHIQFHLGGPRTVQLSTWYEIEYRLRLGWL